MHKYLEKKNEVHFDKIFNQVFGKYCAFVKYLYIIPEFLSEKNLSV